MPAAAATGTRASVRYRPADDENADGAMSARRITRPVRTGLCSQRVRTSASRFISADLPGRNVNSTPCRLWGVVLVAAGPLLWGDRGKNRGEQVINLADGVIEGDIHRLGDGGQKTLVPIGGVELPHRQRLEVPDALK